MPKYKDFSQQKWIHKASLYWIVNGQIKECIKSNVPYPVAMSEKRKLQHTNNYKPGLLVVISDRIKDLKTELLKYKK